MIGRFLPVAAASILLTTGCSSSDENVINVFAASSLTDAFSALEAEYERDHPGVDIRLNLGGSNALQRQILDGADADIFAPADVELFETLPDLRAAPLLYATNRLTLVVPAEGERKVSRPADLELEDVLLARCATGVPCGDAADHFLDENGLVPARSTDEPNVRAVLTKVARGEVDAGFVYVTDAKTSDEVTELPLEGAPTVTYGVMALSADPEAESFATFVASEPAARILLDLGFTRP